MVYEGFEKTAVLQARVPRMKRSVAGYVRQSLSMRWLGLEYTFVADYCRSGARHGLKQ